MNRKRFVYATLFDCVHFLVGITGITYRMTQGVVKHIIPAVSSTNAVIAAACSTEVFKLVSYSCKHMNNYMVFNDTDGIYTYTYEHERRVIYFSQDACISLDLYGQ